MLKLEWNEIADIVNKECRPDDVEYKESTYRKPYYGAKKYYEAGVFNKLSEKEYFKELQLQKQEIEKEKIKLRDERNELMRVIREEARKESYKEQVLRSISEHQCIPLEYSTSKQSFNACSSDNDLIISCTDIHSGIEIDNFFNKFDQKILRDRFTQYLNRIFEIQLRHGSENAYVILSELVSGIIHNELRIENNQNLIDQFLTVIDCISQFLIEISDKFKKVTVCVCPGNHSRISPKKEDSLKGENIDHLAIPYLKARLQNFTNIKFIKNTVEESIAMFTVRGNVVMASHGDKDAPNNVVHKFTLLFGIRPALIYLGHRHRNGLSTVYLTKVIESGTMAGTDNYALDSRLYSKPSQTISVITKSGLDCLYDIEFN